MIDMAGKRHSKGSIWTAIADLRNFRWINQLIRLVSEIDPDNYLHFAARITVPPDPFDIEFLGLDQGGYRGAAAFPIKAPTVIAAFDFATIERAFRQRDTAMRTDILDSKWQAVGIPSDQDSFA